MKKRLDLTFKPLTPERWPDLVKLFGEKGACGGCWCMWWRLPRSQFNQQKGEANKKAFKKIVESGARPGIIAYYKSEPIAWCAFAPRDVYSALGRSRNLKPVDDQPVWSITCLFVARPYRRSGVSQQLLAAAAIEAKRCGAKIIEGYPTDANSGEMPDAFVWTGLLPAYEKAGFVEVLRRAPTRPIVRKEL